MKASPANLNLTKPRWSQLVPCLLAITWMVGSGVLTVHADRTTIDPTRTQTAFPLATPVTMDGVIDAAEWGLAGGFQGNYWSVHPDAKALDGITAGVLGLGPLPEDVDDLSYTIYAGYDNTHLYIGVRVRDDQLFNDSAEAGSANGNTWEDDSVEVFVDGANANDPQWAAGQVGGQFVITANNAYREAEAGNPGYGPEAAWYAQATARGDGSGYDAEFKISLATLGNPRPGDIIGFTVAVNDDDAGGARLRQVLWIGEAHRPVSYGNLLIGPRSYTAPPVTQAPVVDGVINAAEYANAQKVHLGGAVGLWDFGGPSEDTFSEETLNYDWWIVHTADAVYVGVNVVDDQVINDNPDAQPGMEDGNTWEDDSVEIFFDSDFSKNTGGPNIDFEGQYVFTASGARRDNEARNPTFGAGPADWFAATSRTTNGYQVEFRIPKANLQNPTNGTIMGFMTAVNDENDPTGPYAPGNQLLWFGPSHREYTYGSLKLDGPATVIEPLRIVEARPDLATGDITLRWEGGAGPLFQVQKAATVTGPFEPIGLPQSQRTYTDKGALRTGAAAFYRVRQGSGGFPVPSCITTPGINSWVNTPFANQTGIFTATFDVTPSQGAPLDAVIGLSSGPKTAFGDFASLVRLNSTGKIDARNGGAYTAANDISYSANVRHSFRLVVNVPARTYSIYVTPAGGAEQTVGIDFAFRPTAGAVTNLDNWAAIVDTEGSATICNFKVVPECVTTPAPGTWVNTPFANQTGIFTATFGATPSVAAIDSVMALSSGPKTAFADFACLVRFNPSDRIDARNGGVYAAANDIPYSPNVKYSFRLVVNVPARTYSIFVTPDGGTEQTVGTDFAFRPTAGPVTNLDNWGVIVAGPAGSTTVCAFKTVP